MTINKWWKGLEDPVVLEMAWERLMNVAGAEAYERNTEDQDLTQSQVGQRLLQRLLRPATDVVRAYQSEMIKGLRDHEIRAAALSVPAETVALVTLRYLLDKTFNNVDPHLGCDVLRVAKDVGEAIETECRFRLWVEQSKEQAKEYAKLNGQAKVPRSRAELIIAEAGVSSRTAMTIRKNLKKLAVEPWSEKLRITLGAEVVLPITEALQDVFEVWVRQLPDRKLKMIRMKEEFIQELKGREAKVIQMQVIRKPMLVPPRRWTLSND